MSEHEPLALKYRPRHFSEVAGQAPSAAVLYQMAVRGKLPSGMLLTGPRGTGKTSTARILGAALNCAEPPGPAASWPCGACPECRAVANGTSLSVREIDAASSGGVDDIRSVREQALYGTGGEWAVWLLDEAHAVTRDGFGALLKVLEEPPSRTLFVLLTTEPGKIPPTVRSRLMGFPFRPVSGQVITARLAWICQQEGIPAETELLAAIAAGAEGGMRDAIMQLDQMASVGITSLALWRELTGEADFAPAVLQAAADGDDAAMYAALDAALGVTGDCSWIVSQLVRCLRDMLVLSAGADVAADGDALERRRRLAGQAGPARLKAAIKVLWDFQTRVRAEDRRAGLDLAVSVVGQALCPPRHDQVPANGNGHHPVGADELRGMMS